jgi:hypothetical protein
MYELDSFIIIIKRGDTSQKSSNKRTLKTRKKNEQEAQSKKSTNALENEHKLAQKVQLEIQL